MSNEKKRLEYLRGEIEAERISYGEIAELQSLAEYIEPGDVVLLEWAGIEENVEINGRIENKVCYCSESNLSVPHYSADH